MKRVGESWTRILVFTAAGFGWACSSASDGARPATDGGTASDGRARADVGADDGALRSDGTRPGAEAGVHADGGVDAGSSRDALLLSSPYPRLGSYLIGGSPRSYDDPSYIAWAAKQQVILMGIWDGWLGPTRSWTMAQVIQAIHSASTLATPTVALLYVDMYDRGNPLTSGDSGYGSWQAMNANQYWLYDSFPGGSVEADSFGGAFGVGDMVRGGHVDGDGRDYATYAVDYTNDYLVGGGAAGLESDTNAPDPYVDGFYHDEQFWETPQAGDWARTGTSSAEGDATASTLLRQGEAYQLSHRAATNPTRYVTGNLSGLASPDAVTAEFTGLFQGGVLEGMLGETWSIETWSGFPAMIAAYQKQISLLVGPALGIFGHDFVQPDGTDPYGSTPYQAMRYGIAVTLLGDAYYFPNEDGAAGYDCNNHLWFDEFDNAGAGVGYLGQPLGGPAYGKAWQNGVFRRDFQHGIALANPKGNGAQTVTLEKSYKHILGTQDPVTNNGQSTTSVTLADRDGIILLD
jgi:hypothetical protein